MFGVKAPEVSPGSTLVDSNSSSSTKADDGEISIDDQEEKKITLGDALSMNQGNGASLASVEELQTLAGGADIKVTVEKLNT